MHILKLYPAYGRSYDSLDAAKTAFLNGADFSVTKMGGPYCSIRDFASKEPTKARSSLLQYDAVGLVIQTPRTIVHTVITVDDMKEYLS